MQLIKLVEDMRKTENGLEDSVLAFTKDLIDREAHVGIKHVEASLQLDRENEELKVEYSRLDDIITLLKSHLENIQNNFA